MYILYRDYFTRLSGGTNILNGTSNPNLSITWNTVGGVTFLYLDVM